MPTFVRYLLIQLPGILAIVVGLLVARRWIEIPVGLVVLLASAWIVKDLALYPLLRAAYEVDPRGEMEKLAGEEVVARTDLDPSGLVVRRGELWRAELAEGERAIRAGARVRIESARGLLLIVRAVEDGGPAERGVDAQP